MNTLLEVRKMCLSSKQDQTRKNLFKKIFFLSGIIQWNNLDLNLRNSSSLNVFRKSILKFNRPSDNSVFNSHKTKEIEFIT